MYILYHLCGEAGLMLTNTRVIHVRGIWYDECHRFVFVNAASSISALCIKYMGVVARRLDSLNEF